MSDIRVFVTFPPSSSSSGSAIFAGETLQCKITFRNVSSVPGSRPPPPSTPAQPPPPLHLQNQILPPQSAGAGQSNGGPIKKNSLASGSDRARGVAMSPRIPQGASKSQGHKPSLSLSVPGTQNVAPKTPPSTSPSLGNGSASGPKHGHKHKRSISIVSISSDLGTIIGGDEGHQRGASIGGVGPPSTRSNMRRGHGRSSSLQYSPRPMGHSPSVPQSATFLSTPIVPATPKIVESGDMTKFSFPATRGGTTPGSTPGIPQGSWGPAGSIVAGSGRGMHMHSDSLNMTFKFPLPVPLQPSQDSPQGTIVELTTQVTNIDLRSPLDVSEDESLQNGVGQHRQVLGLGINGDTPRSSGEFYSLANSTTETLLSEYDPRLAQNRLMRPQHSRRQSLLAGGARLPETLMMGYAQVIGTFTLDGSLVQTSQFEEIKRKGVVGGQGGGGVVGLDTQKSDGKFLSSFGWGSFGGAIGGLLGGNTPSSLADMKNLASQKNIPILSTPQSILFVDLRLGPGESRSYNFSFPLPKGLPPSHRGKAIKVNYVLKIGTQRSGKGVQQPKVVEIPFRVFPHVDSNGAFQTHDLLQPIILLKDEAKVTPADDNVQALVDTSLPQASTTKAGDAESSLHHFLAYVDTLIPSYSRSVTYLASPSSIRRDIGPLPTPMRAAASEQLSSRENIEMAILRGGGGVGFLSPDSRCSVFEIARNGHKVASLTLARPAYKLGDTITAVIDFTGATIPCYHIHATLESSESVSHTVALRSPSYILRATRKIHASHSESCLFAQRVQFTPTVPPSASPEFTTSCVSLTWRLNVEFITPALLGRSGIAADPGNPDEELLIEGLLERSGSDERGELWEARQGMLVESFDAHIPVRVYPNVGGCDAGQGAGGGFGGGFAGVDEAGYVV
ncbi:Rgp1-domain-containing protein [Kalaharituber pfeilii]|nr:Rgp1-domain-containing protein [Kalaharituber pfeilii]